VIRFPHANTWLALYCPNINIANVRFIPARKRIMQICANIQTDGLIEIKNREYLADGSLPEGRELTPATNGAVINKESQSGHKL